MAPVRTRPAVVAVVVVVAAFVALLIRPPITEPGLAHELIRMERDDNEFQGAGPGRGFFGAARRITLGQDDDALEYNARRARHAARLKAIIEQYGWPTTKMVGREGARSALRQLDRLAEPTYVGRVIPLVLDSGERSQEVARIVDANAISQQRLQTFGTMWTCKDGVPEPEVGIRDARNVDARRRQFGMQPIEPERRQLVKFGFCGQRDIRIIEGVDGRRIIEGPAGP